MDYLTLTIGKQKKIPKWCETAWFLWDSNYFASVIYGCRVYKIKRVCAGN